MMTAISSNTIAELFVEISWSSQVARHSDTYYAQVNFWRDLVPAPLAAALQGKRHGDRVTIELPGTEVFTGSTGAELCRLARHQFDPGRIDRPGLSPRQGRFYPKGILTDVPGVFSNNLNPFRVVAVAEDSIDAALGHPLAGKPLTISARVGTVSEKLKERGGSITDWLETACQGVGMQAPWLEQQTDFWADGCFARLDETDDSLFYRSPRLVQHLDDTASDLVRQLYGRFITDGANVIDLLSSWRSHLPTQLTFDRVSGIGLNEEELRHNRALTDFKIRDLNHQPTLPYPDGTFDVAICTASIEYLKDPATIFGETARILKPGGTFAITFSNRWFEPKAIRIWKELHDFERIGLVLEYFRNSGCFNKLETASFRGLQRPNNDKYFGHIPHADPVYAVWGKKKTA